MDKSTHLMIGSGALVGIAGYILPGIFINQKIQHSKNLNLQNNQRILRWLLQKRMKIKKNKLIIISV